MNELKPSTFVGVIENELLDRIKSGQCESPGNNAAMNELILGRVAASQSKTVQQLVNDTVTDCLKDPKMWIENSTKV